MYISCRNRKLVIFQEKAVQTYTRAEDYSKVHVICVHIEVRDWKDVCSVLK